MKRDRTGKFIRTWDKEPKRAVKLSLTKTAWQILEQHSSEQSISRSELVERYARSLQSRSSRSLTANQHHSNRLLVEPSGTSAAPEQDGGDRHLDAQIAEQTATLRQENARLQAQVEQLQQELQRQSRQPASQQQWLEAILNLLPTPLLLSDPQAGRVIFSNQAANRLAGSDISSDRLAGVYNEDYHCRDQAGQIIPPDQLPSARAIRGERIHGVELNWHTPTGIHPLLVFAETLPAMHDHPVTSVVVFQDITDRKQTEEQLKASQRFIQQIADATPGVLYIYDLIEQRNIYANRQLSDVLGYTAAEVQAMGSQLFANLMHPDDLVTLPAHLERFQQAQDRDIVEREYRMRHRNGEWRWLWSRDLVFSRTADGAPQQILGISHDITNRKQAEAQLRQSEERYRYLAELIPQLVWTASPEGELLDVNQRWSNFTGLTLEQAKQEGWQAIVHPDDVPVLQQHWLAAQQNGTNYQAEGRLRRADGVYRWHLHQAVPLKDQQGQLIRWFGTATDIDDQKQLEQERDRSLQQEQAAREQAEAANRIKDEFLAVLSHELRSPLNPILGWTTLLRGRKIDEQGVDRALETIERNARLQARLIEDLLDISRILQGKLSLTISPVSLPTVIQAALDTTRLAAEAKNITLNCYIKEVYTPADANRANAEDSQSPFCVLGDANRLQQIVWNLLSNAIKFTPSGGRVEVRLEQIGTQAQIRVSDTGIGIEPEFLPFIFDSFRQADSTTTRLYGGLGLGLAIARHLVELHGGSIHAASAGEDQGATFVVRLPLAVTPADLSHPLELPEALPRLDGTRVLIVDDEADTRELLTVILQQVNAQPIAVASAKEALPVLTQTQPNLLLCDIGMPEVDGCMLIQRIRRLQPEQGGRIPAIALTAYAAETDQQQVLAAGFQRHLAKPVEPKALIHAIAQLVRQPSTSSA